MASAMTQTRCILRLQSMSFARGLREVPLIKHQRRSYARGTTRRIVNVLSGDEEIQKLRERGIVAKDPKKNAYLPFIPDDPVQQNMHRYAVQQHSTAKDKTKSPNKKIKAADVPEMKMETLQEGSHRLGKMMQLTKSRKHREKSGLILLEGHRLVRDALQAGAQLRTLFISRKELLHGLPKDKLADAEIYKVPFREVRIWSDTQNPSGLMAVMKQPGQGEAIASRKNYLPLTLVCDNIRDPGNMGTLIRTAAAVGCRRLLLTKGCVDVWETKVLRAAMGGHFFLPIHWGLEWGAVRAYCPSGGQVLLADPHPPTTPLPPEVAHRLMEGAQAEAEYSLPEDSPKSGQATPEARDAESASDSESDEESLELYRSAPIPHLDYCSVRLSGVDTTLIVGGETQGASPQARKLTFDCFGHCLTIPMETGVDSLNSGVAGSIILYELRRQLVEKVRREAERPAPGSVERAA